MKFYSKYYKVRLDEATVLRAQLFADEVVSSTDYSDSNQTAIEKIKDDHFISKLGEEAVRQVFLQFAEVQGPDYTIYPAKAKSWNEDLFINKIGLAVKTQKRSAAAKYGLSWTFQCGALRKDTILNKPEAWVVFVVYDDLNPYLCYVFPAYQIKELVLEEPKLHKLKGHKKVVYAKTLQIT